MTPNREPTDDRPEDGERGPEHPYDMTARLNKAQAIIEGVAADLEILTDRPSSTESGERTYRNPGPCERHGAKGCVSCCEQIRRPDPSTSGEIVERDPAGSDGEPLYYCENHPDRGAVGRTEDDVHLCAECAPDDYDAAPTERGRPATGDAEQALTWAIRDLRSLVDHYADTCESARESGILESFNREIDRVERYWKHLRSGRGEGEGRETRKDTVAGVMVEAALGEVPEDGSGVWTKAYYYADEFLAALDGSE